MQDNRETDWGPVVFWFFVFFSIGYFATGYSLIRKYLFTSRELFLPAFKEELLIYAWLNGIFFISFSIFSLHLMKNRKNNKEAWLISQGLDAIDKKSIEVIFSWLAVLFFAIMTVVFLVIQSYSQ